MDSITQATLGAAVGEAILGRKIGNKAILWGALAGTIPDLDVLFMPFLDELSMITVHRGISHSIFFAIVAGLLLGWLFARWYKGDASNANFRDWSLLFGLGFLTHSLLDACTTYGTQLFLPFSDYRVGFNNIFIVDPVYTLPFLLSVLICLFLKRQGRARRIVSYLGLGFSTLYLCLTFTLKKVSNQAFSQALQTQNIDYQRFTTGPTPLNCILWYCVAEVKDGYLIGYYSLLDKDKNIEFEFFEQQEHWVASMKNEYIIDRLIWFSKGYYIVRPKENGVRFFDLKFGKSSLRTDLPPEKTFVFYFDIDKQEDGSWGFKETTPEPDRAEMNKALGELWERMKGK